ncbi:restriction endonuclease subunit S [Paenibacillus xylanilyticus]|uniref:restriction endonuclease subunit S n=1 Tax=Paenibacillus xylanilyticus TaxID=248903 RepID=UPI0039A24022
MSREQSLILMLDAAAKMQWNIALILEAKAVEAEKVRNWALNHLNGDAFLTHGDQVSEPLKMHDQLVEMLEGLTRMETGLCNNLKAVMVDNRAEEGGMDGDMFGGMDLGDLGK